MCNISIRAVIAMLKCCAAEMRLCKISKNAAICRPCPILCGHLQSSSATQAQLCSLEQHVQHLSYCQSAPLRACQTSSGPMQPWNSTLEPGCWMQLPSTSCQSSRCACMCARMCLRERTCAVMRVWPHMCAMCKVVWGGMCTRGGYMQGLAHQMH